MIENQDESQIRVSSEFGLRAFGADVTIYFAGQGCLLLFGFIQGLILPKYLPVESYGYLQLFLLYTSYIGILHLGLIDGAFVRWAGKDLTQVGSELKMASRVLFVELLVVISPLCLVCYFLFNPTFQGIALMFMTFAFISIFGALFTFAAQAARRFKFVSILNVVRGATALTLIVVSFVSNLVDYRLVIIILLVSQLLYTCAMIIIFRQYLGGRTEALQSGWVYGKENVGIGIFVLLGNLIMTLFLTTDRIMVSSFFPVEQFAIYAFALTIIMAAYVFVTAVAQVFFPYLSGTSHGLRARAYQLGKPTIIVSWAAFLAIYSPVCWLIRLYLPHYISSLPIMHILLYTVGFSSLILVLHANFYKAYGKQRRYFLSAVMALAVLAIFIYSAIKIWGTLESVAIATVISFGIWYIINELGVRSTLEESNRTQWKGMAVLCSYIGASWLSSLVTDSLLVQTFTYSCLFLGITWLFLRKEVGQIAGIAGRIVGNTRAITEVAD